MSQTSAGYLAPVELALESICRRLAGLSRHAAGQSKQVEAACWRCHWAPARRVAPARDLLARLMGATRGEGACLQQYGLLHAVQCNLEQRERFG